MLRRLIAIALAVPASFICLYGVRFAVDMLVRILPPRVSDRLFAPTPKETVGVIGVEPFNIRQLLAMLFLTLYGRHLYHSARGWLRRRRRARERRAAESIRRDATPAAPSHEGNVEGAGKIEGVERG
jgi:hypothetical protein